MELGAKKSEKLLGIISKIESDPSSFPDFSVVFSGIIIRVYLSWNFGRLVPGVVNSHRYETRTI